ncbi:MAG: Carbon monoxide dehydrogenase large chain, partial [Alphaproteobacteria bacterium MarineAlpha3_Bin1]
MTDVSIGQAVKRAEDERFLTGQGNYIDDINLDGQARAAVLRSPHAHARINGIDASAAEAMDGVLLVITGRQWVAEGMG